MALAVFAALLVSSTNVATSDAAAIAAQETPPLFSIDDLSYEGAFRLELGTFGASRLGYAQGVFAVAEDGASLYLVSHTNESAIAEFPRVAPSTATDLDDLPIAGPPLQNFVEVLDRPATGNPQAIDRIGGLIEVDGALIANGYEYYDAPADNTHTTLAISNAADLAGSPVVGWAELGGAAHASGWMSPIPSGWQAALGATHLSGNSSGEPINGRASMGPSAFAVDLDPSLSSVAAAEALLDFDLASPLDADLSNDSLTNDLWTHLSRAVYGFIVPGTSTYLTLGHSGGHDSGVSYGIPPWGGYKGYHPNDREDRSAYYWLWNVDDFVAVRSGLLAPSAVRPYAAGEFSVPFAGRDSRLSGASWDPASERLLVGLTYTDTSQSVYEEPPLILSYAIDVDGADPQPPDSDPPPIDPPPIDPPPSDPPADAEEVMHAVSCLAGRGRVDTNIVNPTAAAATYRIEFEGLSARERVVEPGDWWRMPITGRFDGDWSLTVSRDGEQVSDRTISITCDEDPPTLSDPEIRVVNACRSGLGYVLFQFVNAAAAPRSYVIEFDDVPNRSTTAAPHGQSIRAVTGRQPGTYTYRVFAGGGLALTGDLVTDCS